jgi:hypothetical protein
MRLVKLSAVLIGIVTASITIVSAVPPRSAEETQAMLDFKLSMPMCNQLLSAMGPMTRYVASLPNLKERMARAATQTLAQRAAEVEKDPKAMGILKQNNLTARDYIVGVATMRQAIWLASGRGGAGMVASPANLAFAKANLADLKPRMDAADGMPPAK